MKRKSALAICLLMYILKLAVGSDSAEQNWTNYVRIGAYGLQSRQCRPDCT